MNRVSFIPPDIAATVIPDPSDMPERRRALDTRHSFIVQAPAGSG